MAKIKLDQVMRSLSDDKLKSAVGEAFHWQQTGVLVGNALEFVAQQLQHEAGLSSDDILRTADALVIREAARRYGLS